MKRLSNEAIQDFKRVVKKKYGRDLSDEEANELGGKLLRGFARAAGLQVEAEPLPDNIWELDRALHWKWCSSGKKLSKEMFEKEMIRKLTDPTVTPLIFRQNGPTSPLWTQEKRNNRAVL